VVTALILATVGSGRVPKSSAEVQRDREDGEPVVNPQNGEALEHPPGELRVRPRLHFNMNEDDLGLALAGLDACDDVRLAHLSYGNAGEDFFVEKPQGPEIESFRHIRIEQLEEALEHSLENRFEELVLARSRSSMNQDEIRGARPPSQVWGTATTGKLNTLSGRRISPILSRESRC
jgi:hypothetical protein